MKNLGRAQAEARQDEPHMKKATQNSNDSQEPFVWLSGDAKLEESTVTVPPVKRCRTGEVSSQRTPSPVSEMKTKSAAQVQHHDGHNLPKHQQRSRERDDAFSESKVPTLTERPPSMPSLGAARNKRKK
ncbi:hypothetical protein MTO96_034732 [Rhipicephalus appendiculatus]